MSYMLQKLGVSFSLVGNIVYDNITPKGVPHNDWLNSIGGDDAHKITIKDF